MLVGTLVVGHLGHRVPRGVIYAAGYILMGIMTVSLGVSSGLLFGLLMIALRSASNPFIFVANSTIVQTVVPDEYRGRMVGLNAALPEMGRPLAVVLGGWIADTMGVTSAFLVSGLLFLVAALVALSSWELRMV